MYVDMQVPFGLRSAPKIFTAMADSLEWTAKRRGIGLIEHYPDDFILMGGPDDDSCERGLESLIATCVELGVPLAGHKQEGMCTWLTFWALKWTLSMAAYAYQQKSWTV